jgi:hypothetical protein
VTVAIALTVAGLVVFAFNARDRRVNVASQGLELLGIVSGARLQALASGNEVSVMLFPDARRIIVYEDATDDLYDPAAALHFENYNPLRLPTSAGSTVLDFIDFGTAVDIGPPTGWGVGTTMPAPFDGIDLGTGCGFCLGPNRRGAIVFDSLGGVRFQARNGAPLPLPKGASFTLTPDGTTPVRSVVVAAPTGAARLFEPRP